MSMSSMNSATVPGSGRRRLDAAPEEHQGFIRGLVPAALAGGLCWLALFAAL